MPKNRPPRGKQRIAGGLSAQPILPASSPSSVAVVTIPPVPNPPKFRKILLKLHESNLDVLRWLRGLGVSSILLGGVGLMKTFYLPSVIAVYVGFGLLTIDALYEKLPKIAKAIFIVASLGMVVAFTRVVVQHKSPMQYQYRITGSDEVELSIRNDSLEDDYADLDMLVSPSQKESFRYVGDVQIVSADHSCYLVRFPNEIPNQHMSLVYSPDGKGLVSWSDSFRVRCDKLPHSSTIWVHVKIITSPASHEGMPIPANPIGVPYGVGTFTSKFRTENVNTKFTVY